MISFFYAENRKSHYIKLIFFEQVKNHAKNSAIALYINLAYILLHNVI